MKNRPKSPEKRKLKKKPNFDTLYKISMFTVRLVSQDKRQDNIRARADAKSTKGFEESVGGGR